MRRSGKTEGNKIQSSSSSVEITQKRGATEPVRVNTVIAVAMMPQILMPRGRLTMSSTSEMWLRSVGASRREQTRNIY